MDFKYPYIKRPLKKHERFALLYFVVSIVSFAATFYVVFAWEDRFTDLLAATACAILAIHCLLLGYAIFNKQRFY